MKKLVIIFLMLTTQLVNAKENRLIGIWQLNDSALSAAWQDSFIFYKSGEFLFNFNQFDDSKYVLNLGGSYKLDKDTLFLKIEYRTILTNGYYRLGNKTLEDMRGMIYESDKKVIEKLHQEEEKIIIKFKVKKGKTIYFEIGEFKYYLVSKDPNEYF